MTKTCTVTELLRGFAEIQRDLIRGDVYTVTSNGTSVATLTAPGTYQVQGDHGLGKWQTVTHDETLEEARESASVRARNTEVKNHLFRIIGPDGMIEIPERKQESP